METVKNKQIPFVKKNGNFSVRNKYFNIYSLNT